MRLDTGGFDEVWMMCDEGVDEMQVDGEGKVGKRCVARWYPGVYIMRLEIGR